MKKIFLILLTLFLISGCDKVPIEAGQNPNNGVNEEVTEMLEVRKNEESNLSNVEEIENEMETDNEGDEPKRLIDFFAGVPDKYFLDVPLKDREESIGELDEENYYLNFFPALWEGNGSFAIFIKPNGDYLFAAEMKLCGPGCEQKLSFLETDGREYFDVTDQYMPKIDFSKDQQEFLEKEGEDYGFNPIFILPQRGTSIEVVDQFSDQLLYKLHWSNGEFKLEEF